ncbi:MAG: T9SS type A sorting domain-containing protein, partial [Calditrichaeota bacterium]|nr:T9SS type A sorting domain-containing protein [Calditrichota bacterium]
MRNKLLIFIVFLCFFQLNSPSARAYWGLRNIASRMDDSVYVGFDADYYAYPVSWARTEINDDEFTWNALDNSLNFAQRFDGKVVLVVSCNSSWACGRGTRAPNDLDRRTPLASDPPEHGYSEYLYDFAYNLVDRIGQRENPVVKYLRFVNEPEYNWEVGENWEQDVDDYVRCLRTFYIAAHAAADANEIEVHISHGGFYMVKQLARRYYRLGERNAGLQDSLITLLQSRYERHATRINTWEDVQRLVVGRGGMPPNYWSDAMAGQTAWLDWFDIHYHWKPRFIFDELGAFNQTVRDSGGEVKPWFAAEAAMQLGQGGLTEYNARFHAGDMARKWILGLKFELRGICTPMTGFPPEHFFGLFDDQQQEYLSAGVYRYLRTLFVGGETIFVPEPPFIKYFTILDRQAIGVVWYDALFDSDVDTMLYDPPDDPTGLWWIQIFDIFGDTLSGRVPAIDSIYISQEPIIIRYYNMDRVGDDLVEAPVDFTFHSVYPNPFNSVFNINYNLARRSPVSVGLYSLNGTEVWHEGGTIETAGNHTLTVDCNDLTSGVYLVRVDAGVSSATRKI